MPEIKSISSTPAAAPAKDVSYKDLPCSKEKITELVTSLRKQGMWELVHHRRHLMDLGNEIDIVHPLKFMSVILKDKDLKSYVKDLSSHNRYYFQWSHLVSGLSQKLSDQQQHRRVSIYLNDFARDVGVPASSLQSYVQSKDWKNMFLFLIHTKN